MLCAQRALSRMTPSTAYAAARAEAQALRQQIGTPRCLDFRARTIYNFPYASKCRGTDALMTDLECPRCGGQLAHLICEDCSAQYQEVRGIPFVGQYERDDILGLIEIAAHAALQGTSPMSPEIVRRLDSLCAGFHSARDKAEFVKSNPEAAAWYFPARYAEWLSFNRLIEGIDLTGR